jgi:hydroxymethylglutaryl-CoA synthase
MLVAREEPLWCMFSGDPSEMGPYQGERRLMRIGIIAHGAYVPSQRIGLEELRRFWGSLSTPAIREKSFAGYDEDVITMGVEAARQALHRSGMPGEEIGAVFLATTSGPYEEKPNVSTLVSAMSGSSRLRAVELGGSPRAGALALLAGLEFSSLWDRPALVVASDAPFAHPSCAVEHGLGAGAAAFIIAPNEKATSLEAAESISLETFGERFRRRGERFLQDLELRQDEISGCVLEGVRGLLNRLGCSLQDFGSIVLPDPDGATAVKLAAKLGVEKEKIVSLTPRIGDTGAAAALLCMVQAMEHLDVGQRLLVVSYGSGVEVMSWVLGEAALDSRSIGWSLEEIMSKGRERSYGEYLKIRGFLSLRSQG